MNKQKTSDRSLEDSTLSIYQKNKTSPDKIKNQKAFISYLKDISRNLNSTCQEQKINCSCDVCIYNHTRIKKAFTKKIAAHNADQDQDYDFFREALCRHLFSRKCAEIEMNKKKFVYSLEVVQCLRIVEIRRPQSMYCHLQFPCKDSAPQVPSMSSGTLKRRCKLSICFQWLKEFEDFQKTPANRIVTWVETFERALWRYLHYEQYMTIYPDALVKPLSEWFNGEALQYYVCPNNFHFISRAPFFLYGNLIQAQMESWAHKYRRLHKVYIPMSKLYRS